MYSCLHQYIRIFSKSNELTNLKYNNNHALLVNKCD